MHQFLKNVKRNVALVGALYALLGIVLLIWPGIALHLVGKLLGAIIFIYGVVNIISYFLNDGMRPVYRFGLMYGAISACVGLVLFSRSGALASIVPVIFGIVLLVDGISDLQGALDLKRMRDGGWWLALVLAVVTLVLGAVLLINPFSGAVIMVRAIGVCLIYQGVSNLLITGRLSRKARAAGAELNKMFGREYIIETEFTDDERR